MPHRGGKSKMKKRSVAQGRARAKVQAKTMANTAANTADTAREVAAALTAAMAAKATTVAAKAALSKEAAAAASAAKVSARAARAALSKMNRMSPRSHCRRNGSSNGVGRRSRQVRSVSRQRTPQAMWGRGNQVFLRPRPQANRGREPL